tara:strand:+ start:558 stop:1154 length:597 start_codon:yes stop_codon:yes gene_type:complete
MSDITKIALSLLTYAVLFAGSVYMLAEPAVASDYIGNFERVPAVENRPPQVAMWSTTPTVSVCATAPISEIQINSAVQFWKRLGYKFNYTQYKLSQDNGPGKVCANKNPTGHILVHLVTSGVRMEDTSLAQTHFYVDNNTNEIEWAIIYLRPNVRSTVLEHELGHALGFLHYNKINHLMNEKWVQGGWDKDGLESKRQ